MKKGILVTAIMTLISINSFAQSPNYKHQVPMGGTQPAPIEKNYGEYDAQGFADSRDYKHQFNRDEGQQSYINKDLQYPDQNLASDNYKNHHYFINDEELGAINDSERDNNSTLSDSKITEKTINL